VIVAARALLVVGIAGVTWTSLAPADRLPSTANVSDKLLHFGAYALLGVVAALAQRRNRIVVTIALLTAFGFLIEVLQSRTGYRDFELRDLLADALGAAFGVLLVALVRRDDRPEE